MSSKLRYVPLKCPLTLNGLHSVISKKTELFIQLSTCLKQVDFVSWKTTVQYSELLGSGLCPLSGILNTVKKVTFQKLDLFPPSGEGRETSTPLGPLEITGPMGPVIEVSSFGLVSTCSRHSFL
jgi:hypothetical protein